MDPVVLKANKRGTTRRSQRAMLKIGIDVIGSRYNGQRFVEATATSIVSAHGARIVLSEHVDAGQLLTIRNAKSGEERPCTVVETIGEGGGRTEVGIEFVEPSPRFWGVSFPPDDWSLRSAEAKQYSDPPTAFPKKK
ncbi:MAG: PilZ domain-containing protein [Candidatus Acidiferrum sp.]